MNKRDFLDYSLFSSKLNYKEVPFSKISQISITRGLLIGYKLSHKDDNFTEVSLEFRKTRNQLNNFFEGVIVTPSLKNLKISKAKIQDIKAMFPLMTAEDKQFYKNIFQDEDEDEVEREELE